MEDGANISSRGGEGGPLRKGIRLSLKISVTSRKITKKPEQFKNLQKKPELVEKTPDLADEKNQMKICLKVS